MINFISYTLAGLICLALGHFFGLAGIVAPVAIFLLISFGHYLGTGRWL